MLRRSAHVPRVRRKFSGKGGKDTSEAWQQKEHPEKVEELLGLQKQISELEAELVTS